MADGDTYTLTHGRYKGATRVSIDKASATTHTLVAAIASRKIRVMRALLMVEGAASTANIHEADSSATIYGAIEAITGSIATVIAIDEDDGVETPTAGKALQLTLSPGSSISGFVDYKENI